MIKRKLKYFVLCVLAVCFILLLYLLYYYDRDHSSMLLSYRKPLINAESTVTEIDSGEFVYEITLHNGYPLPLTCYLRIPEGESKYPVMILLGGLNTGKKAIRLIGETELMDEFIIMTMDYPYDGKTKKVPLLEALRNIPEIRRAVFRSAASVSLMIDYLLSRPEVDRDRVFVTGGSFGAFFTIAAGALDSRIKGVASLYCGGDLSLLIEKNLHWNPPVLRKLGGALIELFLLPMEPLNYVESIAPRPFLMINGNDDEQIPRESIMMLLEKAGEPKDIIWLDSRHIQHADDALLQEMTISVAQWLKKNGLIEK